MSAVPIRIIDSAYGFAACAHRKQKRKYTGEPYVNHVQEVAVILQDYTYGIDVIIAALLHDVLEDTDVTEPEMREHFGDDITDLVLEVTDVSKPGDGFRKQRKLVDLNHISLCSNSGANIKYADLISNTQSIVKYDKDFAKIYLPEKRAIMGVLEGKGNAELRKRAMEVLIKAEGEIARV